MDWIKKQPCKDDTEEGKVNWFVSNPKKTIVLVLIVFCFLVIAIAENIVKFENKKFNVKERGVERYVVLKENPPNLYKYREPDDVELKKTDTLIKKRYIIRTDKNGFIEPSQKYHDPDIVIVFLGGSTTECGFVDEQNRFPYLAGILVEKTTGLKINSYNGGVSGNNSLHSIDILINKVIPLKPDVVVLMHNINDLAKLLYEGDYWKSSGIRSIIVEIEKPTLLKIAKQFTYYLIPNLYERGANLYDSLPWKPKHDEFASVRGQRIKIQKKRIEDEFSMNLETFINICRARNIVPVLMTQQNRFTEIPDALISETFAKSMKKDFDIEYKDYKAIYDSLNQTTRKIGLKNNVMVIDIDQEIPHTKEFIYDAVHFNDNGSKLAAKRISTKLLPIIKVKSASHQ